MLSAILTALGGAFVKNLIGGVSGAFEAYFKKEISLEELHTAVQKALLSTARDIEVSHSQELTKTYATFMGAMEKSTLLQSVWTFVVLSQTVVLLWHQLGIPAIVALGIVERYPSSGSTVEWAYALIAACLGFGPMVLRAAPTNIVAGLKSLIGR